MTQVTPPSDAPMRPDSASDTLDTLDTLDITGVGAIQYGPIPTSATPITLVVGVDVIARARLLRTHRRYGERFLTRVFTPTEVAQARGAIERLAGRFAAKEACAKALGTGIGAVAWHEIEIVRLPGGKPALRLYGRAAQRARLLGLTTFDISISDTSDQAFAIVVGAGIDLSRSLVPARSGEPE
ncbi:MAG: holo-ACP synthase [Ktedonobacterales bacterium]